MSTMQNPDSAEQVLSEEMLEQATGGAGMEGEDIIVALDHPMGCGCGCGGNGGRGGNGGAGGNGGNGGFAGNGG